MACILISVGTNVDREKYINSGIKALEAHFGELILSTVYESESVGFVGDHFLNMAVLAYTDLSIAEVVTVLKAIEDDNGRVRDDNKYSGRTLDLDLLTYDQVVVQDPIELPRDEVTKNAFVLQPLAEIAAEHIHPVTQLNYAQLWQDYDKQKQKLWPVSFNWQQ